MNSLPLIRMRHPLDSLRITATWLNDGTAETTVSCVWCDKYDSFTGTQSLAFIIDLLNRQACNRNDQKPALAESVLVKSHSTSGDE